MSVDRLTPSPAPFVLRGGRVGILLIHGFTGSPSEMSLVGPYLHQRGITVSAPLLPGHGTSPADLNRQQLEDWVGHARHSLSELQRLCQTVFVGGLSLGSLLAVKLAADCAEVAGVVAYSPALLVADRRAYLLPLLKWIVRELPKPPDQFTDPQAASLLWTYAVYPVVAAHQGMQLIEQVTRELPNVACPALVIASTIDQALHPKAAQLTYDRLGAADRKLVLLHNSGHVITLDSEWAQVAEQTVAFVEAHSATSTKVAPTSQRRTMTRLAEPRRYLSTVGPRDRQARSA